MDHRFKIARKISSMFQTWGKVGSFKEYKDYALKEIYRDITIPANEKEAYKKLCIMVGKKAIIEDIEEQIRIANEPQ